MTGKMKLNRKNFLIAGIALVLIAASGTTYILANDNEQTQFKEPALKPAGLPAEAKFNPYTNEYYDSSTYKWDNDTKTYIYLTPKPPEGYTPSRYPTITGEEWIKNHQNSTDKVELAIIKYSRAMDEYVNNHPELLFSSSSAWEVGQDGGPLTILTDLGVKNLPQILKQIDWQNPFSVPLEIAVCEISRTNSSDIYPDEAGIAKWNASIKNKISSAQPTVEKIALSLKNGETISDDEINEQLSEVGVFALPAFYDEIVNQSNTGLVKYAYKVIPNDKLKEFNIQSDSLDAGALRKALENSKEEVEIIKTLSVE